jgi:hypothetical protein
VNIKSSNQSTILNLATQYALKFSTGIQPSTLYYLNNIYFNTRESILGSALDSVQVTLSPYGTAIYTVSLTPDSVIIENPIVGVDELPAVPKEFALLQNYPNPFNPTTIIKYDLPNEGIVTLKIYDILGREIKTLANEVQKVGSYEARWFADGLPSGVYFYRLSVGSLSGQSGNFSAVKKMLLLR